LRQARRDQRGQPEESPVALPIAPPLPRWAAIVYASGSAGSQVLVQTLTVWLFFFYVDAHEAPLAPIFIIGIALSAGRLGDALTDPLIGYWSDVTRSRWGRRVPFIVLGAPFMALAFVLLWTPPLAEPHWLNALWVAIALQVYFFFVTIVGAPFTGIYPEIAVTTDERVTVSAWQLVFGLIGAGFALIATGALIERFGYVGMAIIVAFLGVLPRYIGLLAARGRLHYVPESPKSFADFRHTALHAFRLTITNRNFLVLVGSLMLFQAGLLMVTQSVPFYVVSLLGLSEGMVPLVTASFFVASMVAIPVVVWGVRRYEKRTVYAGCLLAGTALLPLLGLVGLLPGVPALLQAMLIIGLIGLPMSGIFIIPDAMLADVVDEDALATRFRREAMYFSSRSTLEKVGQAIASILFAVLLGLFGATAEESLGIRLVGPAAALCTLGGWALLTWGYRTPRLPRVERPGTGDTAETPGTRRAAG
jgi:glycoside/pentoside/hexuronide:cation symporter, GPH family